MTKVYDIGMHVFMSMNRNRYMSGCRREGKGSVCVCVCVCVCVLPGNGSVARLAMLLDFPPSMASQKASSSTVTTARSTSCALAMMRAYINHIVYSLEVEEVYYL